MLVDTIDDAMIDMNDDVMVDMVADRRSNHV